MWRFRYHLERLKMTEQELQTLMGFRYPGSIDDQETLHLRVRLFPNSVNIYASRLNWIYERADGWFLVEQLLPELAKELTSEKRTYEYFEDFINSGDLSSIDWVAFYEYIDTICEEKPHYKDAIFIQTVEKYRKQLLNSGYDMV